MAGVAQALPVLDHAHRGLVLVVRLDPLPRRFSEGAGNAEAGRVRPGGGKVVEELAEHAAGDSGDGPHVVIRAQLVGAAAEGRVELEAGKHLADRGGGHGADDSPSTLKAVSIPKPPQATARTLACRFSSVTLPCETWLASGSASRRAARSGRLSPRPWGRRREELRAAPARSGPAARGARQRLIEARRSRSLPGNPYSRQPRTQAKSRHRYGSYSNPSNSTRGVVLDFRAASDNVTPVAPSPPDIRLKGLTKHYGDVVAVAGVDLEIRARRVLHDARPVGLGQDDDAADDRRLRGARRAARSSSPERDVTKLPPYDREVNTVFQDYALFPHMTVGRERRVRAARRQGRQGRARQRAATRRSRWCACTGYDDRKPVRALRRPAPARRPRSGDRQPPAGPAARRAARRPRPEAARADADRAQADPARGRDHVRLRHPRPGRGADDVATGSRSSTRGGSSRSARRESVYEHPDNPFVAGFVGISNMIERDGSGFTIRPEKVRLLEPATPPTASTAENGRIADVAYAGMVTRFHVDLDSGRHGFSSPARTSRQTSHEDAPIERTGSDGRLAPRAHGRGRRRKRTTGGSNAWRKWNARCGLRDGLAASWRPGRLHARSRRLRIAATTAAAAATRAARQGRQGRGRAQPHLPGPATSRTARPTQGRLGLDFEQKTGCQVNVKIGNTSDEMVNLMRTGQYDGVSASGDATAAADRRR